MSLGLALALVAAPAALPFSTVNVITQVTLTPKELRERRRRDAKIARLCRSALHRRDALASLGADADTLSKIAERLWHGELGCRKNPDLAITVLRFAIGGDPLGFDNLETVTLLARYLNDRADPADHAELLDLEGILWVRGNYYRFRRDNSEPQWSREQKRAFVARDDIWTFLSSPRPNNGPRNGEARFQALLDPLSPRYAPYEGIAIIEKGFDSNQWMRGARLLLEGAKDLPPDPVRAEALLMRAAPDKDEARRLLAKTLAQRLASPDPAVRAAATTQFAPWSYAKEPGTTAIRATLLPALRAGLAATDSGEQRQAAYLLTQYALTDPGADHGTLLRWADATLRRSDADEKMAGWRSLVRLSDAGIAGADKIMAEGFKRAGGLVDRDTLRAEDMQRVVTSDDYPARARREKIEGVVETEAIFSPDGRVLQVIFANAPPPSLADEVRKVVARRLRLRPAPDRYVRAKLPPIQFRLPTCVTETERTPAVGGALLVDDSYCPQPLSDS